MKLSLDLSSVFPLQHEEATSYASGIASVPVGVAKLVTGAFLGGLQVGVRVTDVFVVFLAHKLFSPCFAVFGGGFEGL